MHKPSPRPTPQPGDPNRPVIMTGLDGIVILIPLSRFLHAYALNKLYTEITYIDRGRARQMLVLTPPNTKIPNGRDRLLALED